MGEHENRRKSRLDPRIIRNHIPTVLPTRNPQSSQLSAPVSRQLTKGDNPAKEAGQRWELAESQLSMPQFLISKVDLFYGS